MERDTQTLYHTRARTALRSALLQYTENLDYLIFGNVSQRERRNPFLPVVYVLLRGYPEGSLSSVSHQSLPLYPFHRTARSTLHHSVDRTVCAIECSGDWRLSTYATRLMEEVSSIPLLSALIFQLHVEVITVTLLKSKVIASWPWESTKRRGKRLEDDEETL